MNQREQQHGIHTLCESLCASVYLCYQNSWAIITELTRHRTSTPSLLVLSTLSICLSALSMCLSVSCPFTFTLPLILTVMTSGMVSCVYFLSITRSSTVLSCSLDRGSSQNMGKKKLYWNFVSPTEQLLMFYRVCKYFIQKPSVSLFPK